MRPFRSLKKRVANIFRRRRSTSNDSWGDSTQTIINWEEEEVQSETNSNMSDWSDHLLVDDNNKSQPSTSKGDQSNDIDRTVRSVPVRTEKNIVLVPYKPKPKNWGNWRKKNNISNNTKITEENSNENLNNSDVEYIPNSPHYSPVHSPQFYEKGIN